MEVNKVNILVTGGCGFIGGHLVDKLVSEGANVTVLDILLNPNSIFAQKNLKKKVNFKFIDIRDRKKVLSIFKKYQPNFVFHLAAEAIVQKSYENPYTTFETNIMGTVNILDASLLIKSIRGIIVASSDKAYGKTGKIYTEDTPLRGDHPYDASKSCEDLITQSYYKTYSLPVAIARFGNVYGEGDLNFGRIIPDICLAIIKNKPITIRSDGTFIRDYIYVQDVVEGYVFLIKNMKKIKGEAFNFSSRDNLSVINLIKLAEKILKLKIPYKILNNAKNEIPFQHLNDQKIRKLGWKTNYSFDNCLEKVLKWYEMTIALQHIR